MAHKKRVSKTNDGQGGIMLHDSGEQHRTITTMIMASMPQATSRHKSYPRESKPRKCNDDAPRKIKKADQKNTGQVDQATNVMQIENFHVVTAWKK
jgi:hypothetical protein